LRPSLASVEDGDNLEAFASRPVWNHVACARHDELCLGGGGSMQISLAVRVKE
jgi:hypothetical protein